MLIQADGGWMVLKGARAQHAPTHGSMQAHSAGAAAQHTMQAPYGFAHSFVVVPTALAQASLHPTGALTTSKQLGGGGAPRRGRCPRATIRGLRSASSLRISSGGSTQNWGDLTNSQGRVRRFAMRTQQQGGRDPAPHDCSVSSPPPATSHQASHRPCASPAAPLRAVAHLKTAWWRGGRRAPHPPWPCGGGAAGCAARRRLPPPPQRLPPLPRPWPPSPWLAAEEPCRIPESSLQHLPGQRHVTVPGRSRRPRPAPPHRAAGRPRRRRAGSAA